MNTSSLIATFAAIVVGLVIAIIVHELGHLAAGLRAKLHFVAIGIGPLALTHNQGRPRVMILRLQGNILGYCLFFLPDRPDPDLRQQLSGMIAGGLLASLALGVGLLGVGATGMLATLGWFGMMLTFTGYLSLLLLVANLYPAQWISTDGRKLLELWRSESHARRLLSHTRIAQAALQGIRPREWDEVQVRRMTALQHGDSYSLDPHYLAYRWALDRKDEAQAERYLSYAVRFRKRASPNARAMLLVEAAFFECRYRANQHNAEQWLRKLGQQMRLAPALAKLRLTCAASLVLRDYPQARLAAMRGLQVLEHAADGFSASERALFEEMIDLCNLASEMSRR